MITTCACRHINIHSWQNLEERALRYNLSLPNFFQNIRLQPAYLRSAPYVCDAVLFIQNYISNQTNFFSLFRRSEQSFWLEIKVLTFKRFASVLRAIRNGFFVSVLRESSSVISGLNQFTNTRHYTVKE